MDDPEPENRIIILFDGVCNLCNGLVRFVLKRDKKGIFHFASLQSDTGRSLLRKHNLSATDLDTFVLIEKDKAYTKSAAGLRLLRKLGGLYAIAYTLTAVPGIVRDAVYNFIARNRYAWFGKRESCMLPSPEWKSRFLDA